MVSFIWSIAHRDNANIWLGIIFFLNQFPHIFIVLGATIQNRFYSRFLRKHFQDADKNRNKCLNFDEVRDLVEALNVKLETGKLLKLFHAANHKKAVKPEEETLDEEEFLCFYYSILERPELKEVFEKYARSSGNGMTPHELMEFQIKEQKIELSLDECAKIISSYEPKATMNILSKEGTKMFSTKIFFDGSS